MAYFLNYNSETGQFIGFYNDEFHDTIPEPFISLTDEEWHNAVKDQAYLKVDIESKTIIDSRDENT